ncbi:FliI/YscN family ATPase [Caulobacter sp. DWR1-3-2b1]|uniref:FliI/YscN family ATPase n=1 Tax=Caulobacter sp. DWR1-3-2b1 TaxID=2804670 RepID=UPI003CEED1BC
MSLSVLLDRLARTDTVARVGRVTRILPTYIQADGPAVARGAICAIQTRSSQTGIGEILAQVVGVNADSIILAPFETGAATFPGAVVTARGQADLAPVGDAFMGRAVDAFGRPLDGGGPIATETRARLGGEPGGALERTASRLPLETGVRAIDSLLTLGQGQRVGVFAAAGVGKTSLMNQLARQVQADRCVICLVGERGREVEALWSRGLSKEAKARTVLVAATSDEAAAMRVRAGDYALALADHWRRQGHHVLFLLDSATRLAMALRETGLAAGEPPTVRAYTPGVFAAIPRLVEGCGALASGGAITAVMTVLAESDEVDDPISEMMKSLLDGHILLSRKLAEQGHFPAIDVPRSISRLSGGLVAADRRADVERALALLSVFEHSRTLIETGVYARGASPQIDEAIDARPALNAFLRQATDEHVAPAEGFSALSRALGGSRADG